MSEAGPRILEAQRLPELLREVCRHAGMPLPPDSAPTTAFVVRAGAEPPGFFRDLLEEALVEDAAEVAVWRADDPPSPGHVAVRPGFDGPCPTSGLRAALGTDDGKLLLFAIERRDAASRLLGVTWAAVPEGEPAPLARFRAAVVGG
jgi:hypothetical protein